LILKNKIKRSQPSAAPTGTVPFQNNSLNGINRAAQNPQALRYWGRLQSSVGAAEGCDLLILKGKIRRSQPAAAPTGIVLFQSDSLNGIARLQRKTLKHFGIGVGFNHL